MNEIDQLKLHIMQQERQLYDLRARCSNLAHNMVVVHKLLESTVCKPGEILQRYNSYMQWEVGCVDQEGKMAGSLMVHRYGC